VIETLAELFWACVQIGLLAFGGGNAAIPLLQAAAVPRWISEPEFAELVGINFAFPGVSILKLAGMIGLRAAGPPGLLVAVIGLATPGLLLTIGAYELLSRYRDHYLVARASGAMQYAAVALLASSALSLLRSASASGTGFQIQGIGIAVALFGLVYFLKLAPVVIVLLSIVLGVVFL
jgi:chromate transporter